MPHPHRRTWALGTLDRDLTYRLWFDADAFRWEVLAVDQADDDGLAERGPHARKRSADVGVRGPAAVAAGPERHVPRQR